MKYEDIVKELVQEIDGGTALFDLFMWLEENPTVSETIACQAFDDNFFVCEECGWTLPLCSLAYDSNRDFECEDCYEEPEDLD